MPKKTKRRRLIIESDSDEEQVNKKGKAEVKSEVKSEASSSEKESDVESEEDSPVPKVNQSSALIL